MSEEIDEVALNTLLAEGVDFPTAWAASLREKVDSTREGQPEVGAETADWVTAFALLVLGIVMLVVVLVLFAI